ncbi:hypothetical protein AN3213.2 [Aspergillus nidulans FGSC A4]|uniref:Uncharacterized protein n=1 Tax=Emericella nidulans (strain FGSC A4 / ATCC 38163 / CBS 112.46 / NRRL 194 / M139) TaxID=227321 RepID=Q5B8B7_EMENI|nr:protein bnfA [Aspergillus nidulans FGSC A4]EAA62938.1 hypothetical protein AN3213.2 [Aspergillus nidulans FGSC A4]CBF83173.1 TPA: hypothetical protein ANIA_03213 [Aspergillus nidulans FGSC A4]|eukprot:XP_660817.1 hypothetical protein AN3213.2 [Aspergillus nidulans FGSC A4]
MAMAPVKFTKPPDLSGRTPIYRLSKTVPPPAPAPQPSASPQFVNKGSQAHTSHYQPPYPPHPPPFNIPHTVSPASQPGPQPQSTPQDNKENAFAHTPQSLDSPAQGSPPMTKRRGRKLQENETLILVNCCLEYQSLYNDNPQRFWYCVATSLKRQIKRNFSSHSCRQIVEELVVERRERRRDVAAGKVKEQPLTELVLATDKWISFMDTASGGTIASPAPLMKRAALDIPDDSNAKRPKPHEPAPSVPPPAVSQPQPLSQPPSQPPSQPMPLSMPVAQPMPPYTPYPNAGLTMPSGPTIAAEFQTLKVDIRSLRMDVQGLRREMVEVRQELNTKLDLILQALQQVKAQTEAKET